MHALSHTLWNFEQSKPPITTTFDEQDSRWIVLLWLLPCILHRLRRWDVLNSRKNSAPLDKLGYSWLHMPLVNRISIPYIPTAETLQAPQKTGAFSVRDRMDHKLHSNTSSKLSLPQTALRSLRSSIVRLDRFICWQWWKCQTQHPVGTHNTISQRYFVILRCNAADSRSVRRIICRFPVPL